MDGAFQESLSCFYIDNLFELHAQRDSTTDEITSLLRALLIKNTRQKILFFPQRDCRFCANLSINTAKALFNLPFQAFHEEVLTSFAAAHTEMVILNSRAAVTVMAD